MAIYQTCKLLIRGQPHVYHNAILTKGNNSRIWNNYGEFTGMIADPGHVDDGKVGTINVNHDNQGVYSLFSANNDAICVAWVTTTYTDDLGGNNYAVSGDFGRICGGTWYASGMFPDSGSDYQPDCFWIDKNGDQPNTGFQVRWPSFANTEYDASDTDPDQFCNNVIFGMRTENDPKAINYYTKRDEAGIKTPQSAKRSQPIKRAAWMSTQLVASDSKSHSAQKLCESDTSLGPDFVHTSEGLFCDMTAKTLYPLCNTGNFTGSSPVSFSNSTECFDMDSKSLTSTLARRGAVLPVKRSPYESVKDWRLDQSTTL